MLGDVGQPDLIEALGGEITVHEVAVDRGPGTLGASATSVDRRDDRPPVTQPGDLLATGAHTSSVGFDGDEPVPELRIIVMARRAAWIT